MKLIELTNAEFSENFSADLPGLDTEDADQKEMVQSEQDNANKRRDKVLMVGRGDNHKKAKRIASNARTNARGTNIEKQPTADREVIQGADDTPHTSQGNISANQMRLGK